MYLSRIKPGGKVQGTRKEDRGKRSEVGSLPAFGAAGGEQGSGGEKVKKTNLLLSSPS